MADRRESRPAFGGYGPRLRAAGAILMSVLVPSCAFVETEGTDPLPEPSRERFAEEAGPLLCKRCGDVSCHGDAARPYTLYTPGRRRMNPDDTYSKEPLTEAEVDANWRSALGFLDAPRGRDTTLIQKALGLGGPGGHRGGVVFEAPSDPECKAIIAWIEGGP